MIRVLTFAAASIAFALPGTAEQGHLPYAGFEAREITSLSDTDIDALQEGSGWGLALPAELNGFPGPAHVLELSEALGLSEVQHQRVTAIFDAMRTDAIAKGEALIAVERNLDAGFRSGGMEAQELERLIRAAEAARADLRFVHLSRHLMMVEVLDDRQVAAYAVLRGYSEDPCASVPEGHDATMWRRHNGCEDT
ncbi:MAG: hypothetical protein AB3N22_04625 [Ruegeria sp.]